MLLTSQVNAQINTIEVPALPEAVTNQVVLSAKIRNKTYITSFTGLGTSKQQSSIHNKVWQLTLGDSAWQSMSPVPAAKANSGRLGMTGVALEQNFYLFGGYSVAPDGKEVTQADSYRYSPVSGLYSKIPDVPVAVDDSVALTYAGRYIYLVSGWHNEGNVNLVQVFDSFSQRWFQATPFPGRAVFGHAGAIVDNVLVICDGVATRWSDAGERSYEAVAACYRGDIDAKNPNQIRWQAIPHPTGKARYRQAAIGLKDKNNTGHLLFVGGSTTPYNYNGVGYDGTLAEPSQQIWQYSLSSKQWTQQQSPTPVMDLRNLLLIDNQIYSLGGMQSGQKVSATLINHPTELLPK